MIKKEARDVTYYFPGPDGYPRGRNFREYIQWREKDVPKDFINSFIPVILAGGRNTRFAEDPRDAPKARFSKPMQHIHGVPSVSRIINQLKGAGFQEEDIYVVTTLGFDYQAEPFWYFYKGDGKDRKINNISFHDAKKLSRAHVVKKFATGLVEYAEFGAAGSPSWHFIAKELPPKKNLLVLHADNVFYSDAAMRWFVTEGGENLNNRPDGYAIFDMVKVEGENGDFNYAEDVAAYAFDRAAYGKVEIPEGSPSISKEICKEIEKNGNPGSRLKSGMYFFNINDPAAYNMALWAEAERKMNFLEVKDKYAIRVINVPFDDMNVEGDIQLFEKILSPTDKDLKETLRQAAMTGLSAARASGLEGYLKECGAGGFDGRQLFDEHFTYTRFCVDLGRLIEQEDDLPEDVLLQSKIFDRMTILIEKNMEAAPELGYFISTAVDFGKAKKKKE